MDRCEDALFLKCELLDDGGVGNGDFKLAAADLTAVPCKRAGRPPLRYDVAARAPVALTALPSGTYLGPVVPGVEAQIPAGAELTLRSTAGVVTIERRVTAMQPGRSGGKVFVRDSEGKVFAVPLVLDAR